MQNKILVFALFLFVAAGCQKEQLNQSNDLNQALSSTTGDISSGMLNGETTGYIIRTTGNFNTALTAVRTRLAAIGAKETGHLKALNMVFVNSDAPDFVSAMAGLNVTIGSNLMVEAPTSVTQPQLSGDNPPSTGNSNSLFSLLWGMDAIDAPQAWNAGYLGAGVKVAVLDGGIYLNHPDLAPNLLLAQGRNFVNLDDLGPGLCALYDECDPTDPSFYFPSGFSHSTHVSGTIAAVDNNIGVIGVAPSAKVIPVKCLSELAGGGLVSWIASAIVYAADQEVDIINMSLGGLRLKGSGPNSSLIQQGIKAYRDAIQYAYSKGVTVICAAGNNGIDMDHNGSQIFIPAGSPHAISISATSPYGFIVDPTTDLDVPTSYTNYGSSAIDFAAPGGDFDYPAGGPVVVPPFPNYAFDLVLSVGQPPSSYSFAAGTSMAAPHVSGVAALIIGKYGHGVLTPAQVKAKLRSGVDDLGKPGKDPYFGSGRVNAFKSLE